MLDVRRGPAGRRYERCASVRLSAASEPGGKLLDPFPLPYARGVVGAAESVCAMVLCVNAASASVRVLGVRAEGVPGVNVPLEGGRRVVVASPIVRIVCLWGWVECGVDLGSVV